MQCPCCAGSDSKVTDSRTVDAAIRRRRECLLCGARFTTYERVQIACVLVVKKDGRREEFDREKLLGALGQACAKRPIGSTAIQAAVDSIAAEVQGLGLAEVQSSRIGDLAMAALRRLDPIAYVRFACVYRAFADLGALQDVLDELHGSAGEGPAASSGIEVEGQSAAGTTLPAALLRR